MVIIRKGIIFRKKRCKFCNNIFITPAKMSNKCWKCRIERREKGGTDNQVKQSIMFMKKHFTLKELGLK